MVFIYLRCVGVLKNKFCIVIFVFFWFVVFFCFIMFLFLIMRCVLGVLFVLVINFNLLIEVIFGNVLLWKLSVFM